MLLLQCVLFSKGDPQVRPNFIILKLKFSLQFWLAEIWKCCLPSSDLRADDFHFRWFGCDSKRPFLQLPCLAAELGCNWTSFSVVQMSAGCGLKFTATIYFKGFQSWTSGPYLGIEVSAVIFFRCIRSWFKDLGGTVGRCVTSEALILQQSWRDLS